ncbi:divalent cation tolerance protein CutA [Candidatus Gracilibacteria bacterium]|nr:divalent cation tolerance protein CutA [Candidatus Gracilibacteria bacterium]
MLLLLSTFPNDGRKLKSFILGLIKSGMVKCVSRVNYTKSYYMREGELKKEEEKVLIIKLPEENKEKVIGYFKKNHPYKIPEMIWIKPDDVNEEYLKRIQNL